jgi:hypothetical protein
MKLKDEEFRFERAVKEYKQKHPINLEADMKLMFSRSSKLDENEEYLPRRIALYGSRDYSFDYLEDFQGTYELCPKDTVTENDLVLQEAKKIYRRAIPNSSTAFYLYFSSSFRWEVADASGVIRARCADPEAESPDRLGGTAGPFEVATRKMRNGVWKFKMDKSLVTMKV